MERAGSGELWGKTLLRSSPGSPISSLQPRPSTLPAALLTLSPVSQRLHPPGKGINWHHQTLTVAQGNDHSANGGCASIALRGNCQHSPPLPAPTRLPAPTVPGKQSCPGGRISISESGLSSLMCVGWGATEKPPGNEDPPYPTPISASLLSHLRAGERECSPCPWGKELWLPPPAASALSNKKEGTEEVLAKSLAPWQAMQCSQLLPLWQVLI